MNKDVAINVSGVYKNFKLPHEKTKSIKSLFTGFHKKKVRSIETQHALKSISFEIKKGEFFGIVGRNGSGKSTLLKLLAEIYQPSRGVIQHQGKLVPFIELGVGFNPELTGRENVYLNGALLGFTRKEIDAQYNDIVAFSELEAFMDQKLKNYSSGMQVGKKDKFRSNDEMWTLEQGYKNITFTGFVSDAESTWLYRHCEAYVCPSFMEGFGFPALEAMTAGAAVVSSDATSLPEVCGDAALYFDAHDTSDMAQKIEKILTDDKLKKSLRKKGLVRAKQFSWQHMAKQTLAVYNQLL